MMRLKNALVLIGLVGLFPILPFSVSTNAWFTSPPAFIANETFVRVQSDRITQANWQRHPKIIAVRRVVQLVDAGLRKASFKSLRRQFEYCEPYEDTLRKMTVNSSGVVRRYERQAGSEDSSLTWQHYYDDSGRLRFVFISGGAANGARLEHRIYFDESGQRIWEAHRYLKGPEYSFPEIWPVEQLQKSDPAKAFAAASRCPETKAEGITKMPQQN